MTDLLQVTDYQNGMTIYIAVDKIQYIKGVGSCTMIYCVGQNNGELIKFCVAESVGTLLQYFNIVNPKLKESELINEVKG